MDDLVPGAGAVHAVRLDKLTAMHAGGPMRGWRRTAVLLLFHVVLPGQAAANEALRIVTLAPNLTELVYAAGAGAQLVGTVAYSDFPAAAAELPRIGDAFRFDYEALRLLQPDLILAWSSGNPRSAIDRLREQGYRVEEFEAQSLEDIAAQIERIGTLAGSAAMAGRAATKFRHDMRELQAAYQGRTTLRVFYQVSAQPYFTISGQHVIDELIRLCGGSNVFAHLTAVAPAVSLESIILADPQVIVAPVVAPGDQQWQQDWQRWQNVSAVRNRALQNVSADFLSRSTTRMLQGGRQLCAALDEARQNYGQQ